MVRRQSVFPVSCVQTHTHITLISHKEGIPISFAYCCIPRMQNSACNITGTPYMWRELCCTQLRGQLYLRIRLHVPQSNTEKYEILFYLPSSVLPRSCQISSVPLHHLIMSKITLFIILYNVYNIQELSCALVTFT